MTQDERWLARYNEVKSFIETSHRNPSKYYPDEKLVDHFLKRGRKLMNAGKLQELRLSLFKVFLALSEQYRRKKPIRIEFMVENYLEAISKELKTFLKKYEM